MFAAATGQVASARTKKAEEEEKEGKEGGRGGGICCFSFFIACANITYKGIMPMVSVRALGDIKNMDLSHQDLFIAL